MLWEFIVGAFACLGLVVLTVSAFALALKPARECRDFSVTVSPSPDAAELQIRRLQCFRDWHMPEMRIIVNTEGLDPEALKCVEMLCADDSALRTI